MLGQAFFGSSSSLGRRAGDAEARHEAPGAQGAASAALADRAGALRDGRLHRAARGLAMLVLPGPAFLVIPIGLAILALEFTWAETMLERAIEQGEKARQRADGDDGDAARADRRRVSDSAPPPSRSGRCWATSPSRPSEHAQPPPAAPARHRRLAAGGRGGRRRGRAVPARPRPAGRAGRLARRRRGPAPRAWRPRAPTAGGSARRPGATRTPGARLPHAHENHS